MLEAFRSLSLYAPLAKLKPKKGQKPFTLSGDLEESCSLVERYNLRMADPRAVVPYHDPYDSGPYTEIMNLLNDSEHPRIDENNIPPLEGSLASPNPTPMFDEEIQDVDEPLMDQTMWDFIYGSGNGGEGINSQAGPSQIFTESSGTNPPRGDGNEQNHGLGNVRPLSVWPLPSDPINCTFCQVFREIVHFNSKFCVLSCTSRISFVGFIQFKR